VIPDSIALETSIGLGVVERLIFPDSSVVVMEGIIP
jgi:hypothetical protein